MGFARAFVIFSCSSSFNTFHPLSARVKTRFGARVMSISIQSKILFASLIFGLFALSLYLYYKILGLPRKRKHRGEISVKELLLEPPKVYMIISNDGRTSQRGTVKVSN
jgi:hypothetical protein